MKQMLSWSFLVKFLKFCLVGFSGLAVDFGTTYLCKEKLNINKYLANGVGFSLAATTNYLLNRHWTFNSHNPDMGHEYGLYLLISVVGLGINTFILWLLITRREMNFYLAKICAIVVVTLWNFLANFFITFHQ